MTDKQQTLREAFEEWIAAELKNDYEKFGMGFSENNKLAALTRNPDGSYSHRKIESKWQLAQHIARWADK